MLIGNRKRFGIELTPVSPSWDLRYPPETAAWAGFALWVAGRNLCAHVHAGEEEVRQQFFIPLGPIADWLVRAYPALALEERATLFPTRPGLHECVRAWGEARPLAGCDENQWLDAREAFWLRHFLVAGAEGALVPNVAFLRAEDDCVISWAAPRFLAGEPVSLWHPEGEETVGWREFSDVADTFVDKVAEAFKSVGAQPFAWIAAPIRLQTGDQRLAVETFCARTIDEIVALLGVPWLQARAILNLGPTDVDPAASAVCQIVRDLPPHPAKGLGGQIKETAEAASSPPLAARGSWLRAREVALDAARVGGTVERAGQLAARALRIDLGLDGDPLASVPELLEQVGVRVRKSDLEAREERMLVAVTRDGAPVVTVLSTPRTKTTWGRRFEEARGLGHCLLDALHEGAAGAASTPYAQDRRRRRSGAFAAEWLLPESALGTASMGVLDGARDQEAFEALLAKYGVGARTAAHQLFNHGWLSTAIVRDELIDEHAR